VTPCGVVEIYPCFGEPYCFQDRKLFKKTMFFMVTAVRTSKLVPIKTSSEYLDWFFQSIKMCVFSNRIIQRFFCTDKHNYLLNNCLYCCECFILVGVNEMKMFLTQHPKYY